MEGSTGDRQGFEPVPGGVVPEGGIGDPELGELLRVFEECGLTGSEARCLLALLRLGRGRAAQIGLLASMPRAATYPVLGALQGKGLVQVLPGGVAEFTTPGRDEVVARVMAAQNERHRALTGKLGRARDLLAQLGPESASPVTPAVQLVRAGAPVSDAYERLVAEAKVELLVMNRTPYRSVAVSPTILAALGRGVRARAIYPAADLAHVPELSGAAGELARAGVEIRVAESCPVKLAIADRHNLLASLTDAALPESGFPMALLVGHADFVELQVDAFERRWEQAEAYSDDDERSAEIAGRAAPGSLSPHGVGAE